jgi:hypothetical protein
LVCRLEVLAHNLLVWAKKGLDSLFTKVARVGILRRMRNILQITGAVLFDKHNPICKVIFYSADPFTRFVRLRLASVLAREQIAAFFGEI